MKNHSDSEIKDKVEAVLEKVRPFIQSHGGDVTLIDIKKEKVILHISGRCAHCSLADLTFNHMVKGMIKESVPEIKNIEFKNAHTL